MSARVLLTYGRFDMFDQQHVAFLRHLAKMGREIIVGCASDALAIAQGRPCTTPFETRRAMLESCRYVSHVITEADTKQKRTDIVNYDVSALVMGMEHQGAFDDLQDIAQVLYLPRCDVRPPDASIGKILIGTAAR